MHHACCHSDESSLDTPACRGLILTEGEKGREAAPIFKPACEDLQPCPTSCIAQRQHPCGKVPWGHHPGGARCPDELQLLPWKGPTCPLVSLCLEVCLLTAPNTGWHY